MKTKIFITVISLVAICSCSRTTKHDFLYLNASQLKPLGIELNEKGVFYKNENPDWNEDHEKYACMAFYCTEHNFVTAMQFNKNEPLKAFNNDDSIIKRKEFTRNDFYPLLIGNTKGMQSLDNENLPAGMKLLPVAICMFESKFSTRKDTIVVWIRPTESLKKALPGNINLKDYLRTRPVKM